MKAALLPNIVGFPAESMVRYGRELAGALPRVAGPDWAFEEIECLPVEGAQKVFPGALGSKMASRLGRFVRYPALAGRAKADVYHVLDHSHANLTLSLPPEKTVLTCHDIIPYLAANNLIPVKVGRMTKYTFPLRLACMKRCRHIIADSEATKRDLVQYGGFSPSRITVVYLGLNPVFFAERDETYREMRRSEILAKHGIAPDAKVIFHLGTGTRYKNTPALLEALKILRRESAGGEGVYLLRAGAPFFEDEDALLDTLGIRDRVVHAGRIPTDEELADYYRAADVFAFPSLWEGFGWPPAEAMACGTPAVTSNVASLPEVVGEAGLTVAPQDYAALAGALLSVLSDPKLRRSLGEKARARARRFTWEECARQTLAVYKQVAG